MSKTIFHRSRKRRAGWGWALLLCALLAALLLSACQGQGTADIPADEPMQTAINAAVTEFDPEDAGAGAAGAGAEDVGAAGVGAEAAGEDSAGPEDAGEDSAACDPYSVALTDTPSSSCFSKVGYDSGMECLVVTFRSSGLSYAYLDFSQSDWEAFSSASSLGSYYNSCIKGLYPCQKL